MSKIEQPKVYIDLAEDNYVLTRKEDNMVVRGAVAKFIEWQEPGGKFKSQHDFPAVGRSIVIDPGPYGTYRWLTTVITEVVSDTEFKTENSTYYLHPLK